VVNLVEAADGKINLRTIKALCIDSNAHGLEILSQTLLGFELEKITRADSATAAQAILKRETIDLVLCDSVLGDLTGYELVRWLRSSKLEPNRYAPVFVVTGHTRADEVLQARDSGANFVIAKPFTPAVLMKRVLWVAKGGRGFVETENFTGPDRRHRYDGIPVELGAGRRKTDGSTHVGDATQPNLSQKELDELLKPRRVSL